MRKLREWVSILFCGISGFIFATVWFAGLALHVYTILVAFKFSGFLAAILSFIFPIIAQIYWFVATWVKTESLINPYTFYVLVYLGWLTVGIALSAIGVIMDPQKKKADNL